MALQLQKTSTMTTRYGLRALQCLRQGDGNSRKRARERQTEIQGEIERQTGRQRDTDRESVRQTDRQRYIDRQTDRQIERKDQIWFLYNIPGSFERIVLNVFNIQALHSFVKIKQ